MFKMFKKIIKFRINLRISILLFLIILISIILLTQKYISSRKKASEISSPSRWTLDAIAGKEIKGEALLAKIASENNLREDINIIKSLETQDFNMLSAEDLQILETRYKARFGASINQKYNIKDVSPSTIPTVAISVIPSVTPTIVPTIKTNITPTIVPTIKTDISITKSPTSTITPKPTKPVKIGVTLDESTEGQVKGVSSTVGSPTIGSRELPTIDGVGTDTFTGTSTLSYPIKTPPILGNIPLSINLSYSSRSIDELRLNKPGLKEKTNPVNLGWGTDPTKTKVWEENIFADASSPVGLGWNLSTFGSITLDSNNNDEFMLQLSGKAVRIKWDKAANNYKTYPDNKIKIERVGDLGAWKITDTSGTVYLFGSVEREKHTDNSVEPARTGYGYQKLALSPMSANEYTIKTEVGKEGTLHCSNDKILKWNLSKMSDIHGNTAEVDYEQELLKTQNGCLYTAVIRLKTVKYNWDESTKKYISTVSFNYTDSNGVGSIYYDIYKAGGTLKSSSPLMADNKILTSVETKNNSVLLSRYEFSYTKSYKNSKINFGCPDIPEELREQYQSGEYKDYCAREESGTGERARQLLLTKIIVKGFNNQGAQRPQTFCYKSLNDTFSLVVCDGTNTNIESTLVTPNDLYLVQTNNGYGGLVNYEYEKVDKIDRICFNWRRMNFNGLDKDWRKICTDINGYMPVGMSKDNYTAFYRVKKTTADNGINNKKTTEYSYIGASQGYGASYSNGDGLGYSSVNGLQFLGYPTVRIKAYDSSTNKLLSYVEQKTNLFLETIPTFTTKATESSIVNSCFMVDPRKGMVYESNVLNASGVVIGFTKTDIRVRPNLQCLLPDLKDGSNWNLTDASKGWIVFEPYTKGVDFQIDGKKSKTETVYDFEVYPNQPTRNFGNAVKSIDYGNPDIAGDEVYSYVRYIQDQAKDTGSLYALTLNQYFSKNLINLVGAIYISSENKEKAEDVKERLNWQTTIYDERVLQWGYQSGIVGVRGLPSSTNSIIRGTSDEKPTEEIRLTSQTDYNQYGLPVKQTAPNGAVSTTYYDDTYRQISLCQVQWKVPGSDPLVSQPRDQACDIDNNKDKKIVSRTIFDSPVSLARGLVDKTQDANGAVSKYEYDEYGRVIKSYQPDKVTGQPETTSIAEAQYFDNQSPMRTRTRSRLNIDTKEIYQTVDEFFDGFGNKTQTINYDREEDARDKFAMVSNTTFNGIGQVEEKLDGVPIRNLAIPVIPQLVTVATLSSQKNLATKTNTTYDFFSRPLVTTTTSGGSYGSPIITTSRIVYDGYKAHTYNNAGNQTTVEVQGLKTISTNYLCLGDINCTSLNGEVVTTEITNNIIGKPITTKDARGIIVKRTSYNSVGMPLSETDLDRGITNYYYDNYARLQQVKDANGHISKSTQFDILNRVTQSQLIQSGQGMPETIIETVYDIQYIGKANETRVKKNGVWLQKQTTTFDLQGNPKETIGEYDLSELGIKEENKIITKKISTTSKTGLPLTSQYYVNNTTIDSVAYQYNDTGKLKSVIDVLVNNLPLVENITYDFKGSLKSILYDNKVTAVNEYDNSGRTTKKTIGKVLSKFDPYVPIFYQSMAFNPVTQMLTQIDTISISDKSISSSYSNQVKYDSFGRISYVSGNEYTGDYAFDKTNNLTVKSERADINNKFDTTNVFFTDSFSSTNNNPCDSDGDYKKITGYTVSKNSCPYHAAKQSTINGEVRVYLYDKKGNLVSEFIPEATKGRKVRDYVYDASGMPVKITDYEADGIKIKSQDSYIYGLGAQRLVKKNVSYTYSKTLGNVSVRNEVRDYNLYLGLYEKEKDAKGIITESVNMDVPLASIIKVKKGSGVWVKNYTYTNYQGSTAFILDAQGKYLPEFQDGAQYFRYFAYGGQINNINLATLPRENTYTGQKKDLSTGLMYYNARYYNPATGLFQQPDPVDDGFNRYAYVGGNPIMMTDPSGTIAGVDNLISGGVGFLAGFAAGAITDAVMQKITTGHIDASRALLSGVSTGVYGGCVGLTQGVGITLCGVVSSAVSVSINTKLNYDETQDLGASLASAAIGEAVGLGVGHVGGLVGRELVKAGEPVVSKAVGGVAKQVGDKVVNTADDFLTKSSFTPIVKSAIEKLRKGERADRMLGEMQVRLIDKGVTITTLGGFYDPVVSGMMTEEAYRKMVATNDFGNITFVETSTKGFLAVDNKFEGRVISGDLAAQMEYARGLAERYVRTVVKGNKEMAGQIYDRLFAE